MIKRGDDLIAVGRMPTKRNSMDRPPKRGRTSFGKQAAIWLSEQVGDVGFTEAGQRFGITPEAVSYAWQTLGLGITPRKKMKIATNNKELSAVAIVQIAAATAQRDHKRAYMREYNARTREKQRAYNKQWYQDHKEYAKSEARQYRLDNPEKTREAASRWRDANKEYLFEYNKVYQENNKERIAQNAREKRLAWFAEDPKAAWLYYTIQRARGRAKRKGLSFDNDLSKLVLPDVCPVLGIPLNYADRRKHPAPDSPSLDRIVPPRGYVISNLRVISWRANALKRDASIDEIRRVLAYVEECLVLEKTC